MVTTASHLFCHSTERFVIHIFHVFIAEREQSVDQLRSEINRSDVICVVYSVEDEDTLDRVTCHWLPLIRSTLGQQHHIPVILVGNKVDLVDYSTMEVSSVLYYVFISTLAFSHQSRVPPKSKIHSVLVFLFFFFLT